MERGELAPPVFLYTARVSNPKPIFLVGMMGAGKSTVGPRLASRLGRAFVDTDHEIERRAGRAIAEIFAHDGELHFRGLECEAIEAAAEESAVVALGGGAIAQPGAVDRLRAWGIIIHLDASIACLLERIADTASRPLLAGLDPAGRAAKLEALLESRRPYYAAAHYRVDASGSPDAAVERIVALMSGPDDGAAVIRARS